MKRWEYEDEIAKLERKIKELERFQLFESLALAILGTATILYVCL